MSSLILLIIFILLAIGCFFFFKFKKYIFFSLILVLIPLIKAINDAIATQNDIKSTVIDLLYSSIPVMVFGLYTNWDKVKYGFSVITKESYEALKKDYTTIQSDKKELVGVITKFFNDGKFNKNKIAEQLNINPSDYFVVIKTSENLELLYEKKKSLNSRVSLHKFPLGSILQEVKGSLKPFKNMDVFFIPYQSMSKKYGFNHSKWLKEIIIPKIEPKRIDFINEVKKPLKLTKEEVESLNKVAFTLVSFNINSNSIFAETLNNTVSSDLLYLVRNDREFINNYVAKIGAYLKSNELLNSIEWQTLININKKYIDALNRESTKITIELNKRGINRLVDLINIDENDFKTILLKIMKTKYKWTEKISYNNSKKIISQLKETITILRKAGVHI